MTLSERLLAQRIRNRIMDDLEVMSSEIEIRDYQSRVPNVYVPSELLSCPDDWLDAVADRSFGGMVIADDERDAVLRLVDRIKSVSKKMGPCRPELDDYLADDDWREAMACGKETLSVFSKRGRFPEDTELETLP